MQQILASLGWDAARAAEFAPHAAATVAARITRVDRAAVDAITNDNPVRVPVDAGDDPLVVGDWVALAVDDGRWYVDRLLTRRSLIRRAAVSGEATAQAVAANVDVGFVVVPAVPEPRLGMVERLVALVWDSGAVPVVVVTKTDLVADVDGICDDIQAAAPGVDVVPVSARGDDGLAPLHAHLDRGRTYCLLGRSGAGKSTIANALLGEERFATQDLRSDGKGRHTTTFRELVVLPGGGVLVDTPGLKGVGLWLDGDGLERAFDDVESLATACRFADCAHVTEPGCAVLEAIDDGTLPERRLESWRKLQREAAWMARRTDARARAEHQRQWKAIAMAQRRRGARP